MSEELEARPLLIIECDTDRLVAERLSCADRVARAARVLGVEPVIVKATTADDLDGQLEAQAASFGAVVIIGHGNEDGVSLSSDEELVSWDELVDWLELLYPQRLAFISCKAGRTLAARTLFDGLEHLEEVFASPLNLSLLQSMAIDVLMPALLDPELDEGFIQVVQFLKPVLTGGFLFRWTREGHDESDLVSDLLGTVIEQLVVPGLKDALDDLLGRNGGGGHYLTRSDAQPSRSARG